MGKLNPYRDSWPESEELSNLTLVKERLEAPQTLT